MARDIKEKSNQMIGIINSALGHIKLTMTGENLSAVEFTAEPLQSNDDPSGNLKIAVEQLTEYFNGKRKGFSLPLAFNGTEFQNKVWKTLGAIPYGKTISYLQLAERLSDPKCIRAAAHANGKNPFAIVVPCHRVIGSGGDLVGYAGGLDKKAWLLQHEHAEVMNQMDLF